MPVISPSRASSHIDVMLTDVSIAYGQSPNGFVAGRVFQQISVGKSTNAMGRLSRASFNRNDVKPRAPGAESQSVQWERDHDLVYRCKPSALSTFITDDMRDDEDDPFDADSEATLLLTNKVLIERDVSFAAEFLVTTAWTGESTGVAAGAGSGGGGAPGAGQFLQWDDDDSTPIEDVRAAKTTRQEATGFRPNVMTLGRRTFDALIDHPDIVARVNQGQTPGGPAMVNKARLEEIFELEEILVMDSVVNTAIEGAVEASSFIGGKVALLTYRPPAPGKNTPAAGYTFTWKGERRQNGPQGWSIEKWYEKNKRADKVEINQAYDFFQTGQDLGHLFLAAVA